MTCLPSGQDHHHAPPALPRPGRCFIARSALSVLAIALVATLLPTVAQASPSLTWYPPAPFDTANIPTAVSCASESLCVVVDHQGNALSSSNPTAPGPTWSTTPIDPGESLDAVSCAPGGPCVAVDNRGYAFASTDFNATTWSGSSIDSGRVLTGVSCPSSSLCVAVDEEGDVLASAHPTSGGWALTSTHPGHHLTAVSCSSPTQCVAVDSSGEVLWSSNPAGGDSEWHLQKVDPGELLAISCSPAGSCVALDSAGNALASADPTATAPTWSETSIDGEQLTGVSCASSGLCVAVDHRGEALASDNPTAPTPTWISSSADTGPPAQALAGIACLPGGFCLAADTTGHSITARLPAPTVTTLKPTLITDTSATLAALVSPNDAVLGNCEFEYGSGGVGVYSQTIPCSVLPLAAGGIQEVSATVQLLANTTYHYRVVAQSPQGLTPGFDEAFTTPTSSLIAPVHPNPSITGTPANGQRLTCHPGLPQGASAQLTYAWLRDQVPIAGATSSTYTVKGQDTGHHLQCQVTATNGGGTVTANSSFVTIPVGGVPASVGETAVGTPVFRSAKVSVPVSCSALAYSGCEVTLRLAAVETRSGTHILAVAAHVTRPVHGSVAGLRHVTVTLASVRVHLTPGAHATVTATLDPTGRRLLAAKRHFSAELYVSGTVIGVIEAQLAQKLVTLSASSHSASTHAARHR